MSILPSTGNPVIDFNRTKLGAAVGLNLADKALCMSQERLNILLIEHDPGFTRTVGEMIGQARELTADVSSAPGLQEGFSRHQRQTF